MVLGEHLETGEPGDGSAVGLQHVVHEGDERFASREAHGEIVGDDEAFGRHRREA
jgi:hypothetical protein